MSPEDFPEKAVEADAEQDGRERERPLPINLEPPLHYRRLFIKAVPEPGRVKSVRLWLEGLDAINPDKREQRAEYLLDAFKKFRRYDAAMAGIAAKVIIAAQHLVDENFHRETEMWGRQFDSSDEFIVWLLKIYGIAFSGDRLRHQRPAARLYLQIESVGLPVPDCLSALEPFCRPGLKAYLAALAEFGHPPSEKKARDFCEKHSQKMPEDGKRSTPSEEFLERFGKALEQFRERARGSSDPGFTEFFSALESSHAAYQAATTPKPKEPKAPRPERPALEIYDGPTTPATIALTEVDGVRYIEVRMLPLPTRSREAIKRPRPSRHGWEWSHGEDGGLIFRAARPSNSSAAAARIGEAYRWAIRACDKLSAPIPPKPTDILERLANT